MIAAFGSGSWWSGILVGVGAGMVVWVLLSVPLLLKHRRVAKPATKVTPSDLTLSGLGVAYPYRSSFETLRQKIDASHEVWAFWHTAGNVGNNPSVFQMKRIRKLLLIAPDNTGLRQLSEIVGLPVDTLVQQINTAKNQGKESGCEVKYWYGSITNSVTIGNPQSVTIGNPQREGTWLEIEALLPFTDPNSRPKIEFTDKTNPQKCNEMEAWFIKVWTNSGLARETDTTTHS